MSTETETTIDVEQLADQMSEAFTIKTRPTSGEEYWCLKDGSPEWMRDVVHEVHGSNWPDDATYRFIGYAVERIADGGDMEGGDIEPDIYTKDLLHWLLNYNQSFDYCNEAIKAFGLTDDIEQMISGGQALHLRDVFANTLAALERARDNMEDEEENA